MSAITPGVPAPHLAPLIGQATLRERGGVGYRQLEARSLLNRCDSPRVPFAWTVNPYRGCAIGCRYCYAAYTHDFMGKSGAEEFHSLVYVKQGGLDRTAERLRSIVRRGELVALGTATDPYQPGEAEAGVTRRFLELVAQHRGVRLSITTKGALILRDIDLLGRIQRRSSLSVHVSLISPRPELLRRLEPWAPPPAVRLEVMRRLGETGVDVWHTLAPVLPGLTDDETDLDQLLARVAQAGVRRMTWNLLFLRSPTREKFMRWLNLEFPRYGPAYEAAYRDRVYLRGAYRERLRARIERLRERHGLMAPPQFEALRRSARNEQLPLWG